MTNLEALKANISDAHGVVLTEDHFVKALIDVGLLVDEAYGSPAKIDRATIALYDVILTGANLSEGHLSYSIDINAVRQAKEALEEKLGVSTKKTVRSPKVW